MNNQVGQLPGRSARLRGRGGFRFFRRTIGLNLSILVGAAWTGCAPSPTPPNASPEQLIAAIARGRELYEGRRCINCHGADALGKTTFPGAPRIVGRQLEDLRVTMVLPCGDPAVPGNCHPVKMPDLTDEQLSDLAAYLGSLAGGVLPEPGPSCDDVPGHICTVAGNGLASNQSDAILARSHSLFWPQNVTVDPQGRAVITDWNNYTIRRIESSGCVTTTDAEGREGPDCPIVRLVGTGLLGDSCSTEERPILAVDAMMNHPVGVLYDDFIAGQNNIILWGWHQWKIKYVPLNPDGTTGEIYCLFGNERGATADGLPAGYDYDGMDGPTRFNLPSACVYDNQGNFYIADQGNLRIRVVLADADDDNGSPEAFVRSRQNNIVTRFAGGLLDEFNNFRRTAPDYSNSGDGGPASDCTFNVLSGFDAVPQMRLAMDRGRNRLYVADSENHRIRVIDLNQDPPIIDTFAGGGDDAVADNVPATHARLHRPGDVDLTPDGNRVLITDTFNHCVRLVDVETGLIRTIAGLCGPEEGGYEGDGGPAAQARLYEPGGAGIAADGTVYIADTLNHRVRRVNPLP